MFPENGNTLSNMTQIQINNRLKEVHADPVLWNKFKFLFDIDYVDNLSHIAFIKTNLKVGFPVELPGADGTMFKNKLDREEEQKKLVGEFFVGI